jgi:hypothetical protein
MNTGADAKGSNLLENVVTTTCDEADGELLRHLRGQVIVVLDNSSTHNGAPLQQLLRQHRRQHIDRFPSYAPELNPDEG